MAVRQRVGIDVLRYPHSDPLYPTVKLLMTAGITVLLDVGANDGGFATTMRRLGYLGRIVSFEPTTTAFSRLLSVAENDDNWEARKVALGDRDGTVEINVAGNAAASSSILPMLDRHLRAAPASRYVSRETVEIARLDRLWDTDLDISGERVFLKLDVQGAEGLVLDGATKALGELAGIQTEMNVAALYEGQLTLRATLDRLECAGFILVGLVPGFSDPATGEMLQADGVFMRPREVRARTLPPSPD